MKRALPWLLLLAVALGWAVHATRGPAEPPEEAREGGYSAADVERMQAELRALKAERGRLDGLRRAQARQRARVRLAAWEAATEPTARATLRATLEQDLGDDDPPTRLAALYTLAGLDPRRVPDPEGLRAVLAPLRASTDPVLARAALEASTALGPDAADRDRWLAIARAEDDPTEVEAVVRQLVRSADGRVEGPVADAVLHALRDGTATRRAFVMRALQGFRTLAPAVRERLLDVVSAAPPEGEEVHYFFHFLAPRIDPKSDRLVDLTLALLDEGTTQAGTLLRSLRRGLSAPQRAATADTLVTLLEGDRSAYTRGAMLRALEELGAARHAPRLRALAQREDVEPSTRRRLEAVAAVLEQGAR